MKINLENVKEIKKLNIKKGNILVGQFNTMSNEEMEIIGKILNCQVIRVEDINTIGVLKFK